jgi:DNA-binding transcriptional LysR family regulator
VVFDAESGDRDPLRRQLRDLAQERGLRIRPRMETETMVMALRLVADGVGDTFVPRAHTRAPYFPAGLTTVGLRPVVHETFAIVMRSGARPSPATRAFIDAAVGHMTAPALGLAAV